MAMPHAPNPNVPRPAQFITLPEHINDAIPGETREQLQSDDRDRVLFWSAPPINIANDRPAPLAHSTEYLAAKIKRQAKIEELKQALEADRAAREAEEALRQPEQADEKPVKEETPEIKQEDAEPTPEPLTQMEKARRDYAKRLEREAEILEAFVLGHNKAKKESKAEDKKEAPAKVEMFDPKSLPPRQKRFTVKDQWSYLTEARKKRNN